MNDKSHIRLGSIGFHRAGLPIEKFRVERSIIDLFTKFNKRFYSFYGFAKIVWVDHCTPSGLVSYLAIEYDGDYIEKYNNYHNKNYQKTYFKFFDWVKNCQEELGEHSEQLCAICEEVLQERLPIEMVKARFKESNFKIVDIDFGNSEFF